MEITGGGGGLGLAALGASAAVVGEGVGVLACTHDTCFRVQASGSV